MKQGWEIKKLGEVCSITMGQSPSSDTYNDSEGLPFFQGNADFGKIHPSIRVYCNAPIRIADVDDILISVRAPIGAINIADCKCCIGRGLASIRNNAEVANEYIYHALIANKEKLIAQGTGSTFKSIGKEALKELSIPVPPREEQERIVAELDCLSGIIERKREQLRELDALAQSIFYQMFGDPITNEKGWEVKKWKDMLTIVNGKNQKTVENLVGAYPIYGSGGIMGYADKYLCPKNTIIIGRKGNINKPIFVKEPFWNVDTAFGLIADNIHIAPSYLFFYCRIFNFEQLNKAVTIPSLTKSDLLELNTPCPPLVLQQEFAERIDRIEQQRKLISQSIKETEELFNSRMDYYFN